MRQGANPAPPRRPGGGSKGKLPTMVEKLPCVLSYYKTYPPFDVLGTPLRWRGPSPQKPASALADAEDTLGHLALMPYRELATPEE